MAESWATSGLDLHLEVGRKGTRASLERALRTSVQSGRLAPGTRLPSSRSLAADLGIARNTVAEAYGHLVAEGWFTARQGSGTRVATHRTTAEARVRPVGTARSPRYDLRPGHPNLSAFPRTAWLAAARRATLATPATTFDYPDPRGLAELRATLAEYLARARGVRVSPDLLLVTSGFTQSLDLLGRVLHERGAGSVAVEEYGHGSIAPSPNDRDSTSCLWPWTTRA